MGALHVVVLVASDSDPGYLLDTALNGHTLSEALIDALSTPVRVSVVSKAAPQHSMSGINTAIALDEGTLGLPDRLLGAVGASKIKRLLAKYPAGRLINQLGPADDSGVFWRSVRRSPEAMKLLTDANVVIAADLAAVKTAWVARHRLGVPSAYYGLAAALGELSRSKFGS